MKDKVQIMSVNGIKKVSRKALERNALERNALDILTMGDIAMDFKDALAWVKSA